MMNASRRLGISVLAMLGLLAACGGRRGPDKPAPSSLTVTVVRPSMQEIERELVVSGAVAAWQEMSLGVELSGLRVAAVPVEVGARVRKGQVLLELDKRTLEVQARQADASLAQARASAALARAQAERGDNLLERKLISTASFDELSANRAKTAAAALVAEADRDAAQLRLGFASLRAPDDGIVSARNVQPGQVVSSGAELLRLIRRGRLEWRAEIPENDLARVSVGATVALRGPGGETVSGRVRAVAPALDPKSRTALLYADLVAPGALRSGMFAEGRVQVGKSTVMVVPRQSVVFRDGYPYVFVLGKDRRVAQRRVELGASQDVRFEVRSGLTAADQVVVRGAGFLGDGDVVAVAEESGA
ncbi:MAG: efflux RND transporter periplasmic adaptor subunit [Steroidobacteraceae bacterium]|jgi:RND family efflux transporter MFP subunit